MENNTIDYELGFNDLAVSFGIEEEETIFQDFLKISETIMDHPDKFCDQFIS